MMSEGEKIIKYLDILNYEYPAHKKIEARQKIIKIIGTLKDENKFIHTELDKQQEIINNYAKELDTLKEIEQLHKTDNGLLRQELDMQIEHNKELDATLKQTQDSWFEDTQKLEQEKEKYKKLQNTEAFQECYISKDKIREKIEQTKKVYEEEMKPYQTEYGLDVTYLRKKEKDELINKRNCLLTQIKTYEMLLEEK